MHTTETTFTINTNPSITIVATSTSYQSTELNNESIYMSNLVLPTVFTHTTSLSQQSLEAYDLVLIEEYVRYYGKSTQDEKINWREDGF